MHSKSFVSNFWGALQYRWGFFIIIFVATNYLFNEQSNEKTNLPARCRCRIRSL